jgi:phosphoribosylglycinamide formyltransferase-1
MTPAADSRYPIAVLVSGSGTNLQAILDAAADPGYAATVAVVISDRPGVRALGRADAAGVPTAVVAWGDHPDRESFSTAVCDAAAAHGAEAIVMAGFMRILSATALNRYSGRILNIHPSLLPAFAGTTHAVRDALGHGVKLTGVTVHLADEHVDYGPILEQEAVPVLAADTEDTLHARIQEVEHRLYPAAVDAFARGRYEVAGRVVARREPV